MSSWAVCGAECFPSWATLLQSDSPASSVAVDKKETCNGEASSVQMKSSTILQQQMGRHLKRSCGSRWRITLPLVEYTEFCRISSQLRPSADAGILPNTCRWE